MSPEETIVPGEFHGETFTSYILYLVSFMFGINTIVPTLAAISTFATITKLGIPMPSPEACFLLIAVWNVLGLFSKPCSDWLK